MGAWHGGGPAEKDSRLRWRWLLYKSQKKQDGRHHPAQSPSADCTVCRLAQESMSGTKAVPHSGEERLPQTVPQIGMLLKTPALMFLEPLRRLLLESGRCAVHFVFHGLIAVAVLAQGGSTPSLLSRQVGVLPLLRP